MSEETSGQQPCAATSCTRETLSCVATSMRSLQSLMEQGDFEEISDVFLRICMGEPPAQPRSKAGLTDPVHSSTVPMRMYFGVTRPSSASTAVPSSSLSLCSASMEPSAASDLPQEQGNMNVSTEYENEGRENSGLCRGTNGIGAKRLEGRREESEADASTCPGVPGVEGGRDTGTRCSNVAHDDDSSCAATPSKKEACFSASGEKTGGKSNTAGTAAAFLARRSPRLQKSQDTQRQEPLSSPASKRHYPTLQQQQPWGAPSRGSAAGRGRPHMRGGKRRQGTTVASLGPKRRREEAAAEEAPLSSRGGGGKAKQVNVDPGNEGGAISPPKSATSKRKGHCRGDAAKTAWAGKQARGAEDKGQKVSCCAVLGVYPIHLVMNSLLGLLGRRVEGQCIRLTMGIASVRQVNSWEHCYVLAMRCRLGRERKQNCAKRRIEQNRRPMRAHPLRIVRMLLRLTMSPFVALHCPS